ncbi:SubName: Full=Uncharacterized protein {ECO:0000313/EMBL:CCA75226.1} [Serendipita indica DSM 11827]|nr:SubName: Full=Uncharacterized protein {ECO:0000313/EMBL:CCA75226.1} [Serendipita indica DSM 11827]
MSAGFDGLKLPKASSSNAELAPRLQQLHSARQPFVASSDASGKSLGFPLRDVATQARQSLVANKVAGPNSPSAKPPSTIGNGGPRQEQQRDIFRGFSAGLEGFGRARMDLAHAQDQAAKKASFLQTLGNQQSNTKRFLKPKTPLLTRNAAQPAPTPTPTAPTQWDASMNDPDASKQDSVPPPSLQRACSVTAFGRSSTPAFEGDCEVEAPADYDVLHSLLRSQQKKDRILRDREGQIAGLEQEVDDLKSAKRSLEASIQRVKQEAKACIQKCNEHIQAAQAETEAIRQSSQTSLAQCLDELRRTAPQVDELKAELVNRVQEVESQLVEERQHRTELMRDLDFAHISLAKHDADFLRDKLEVTVSNLADSKTRTAELEQLSHKADATLKHTLKMLETTQSELFATRRAVTKATEDEHLLQAAEEELTKELAALHQRYDEAQMTVQSQKTDLMARQREIDTLHASLNASIEKVGSLEHVSKALSELQEVYRQESLKLAVLQTRYDAKVQELDSAKEQIERNASLQTQLEEARLRCASFESQHEEHQVSCTAQKERLETLEQELDLVRSQHSSSLIKLEATIKELQRAEERLEDNKVLYRSAREDAIKLQDEIDKLQESAATTAQAEVARVKAENARLEAQLHDDPEKLEMKSRIQELEDTSIKARNASTIKIQALEGKLSVSEATIKGTSFIRGFACSATKHGTYAEGKSGGRDQKTHFTAASQKAELNNMTVITNLQQSNENLVALQEQERERAQAAQLAHQASKFDLQTTLKDRDERIRLFKEENTKLIQAADQARNELEKANERWATVGQRMDTLTHGISQAAEDIKSTRGIASEIAKAQESVASHNIAQEVENTTKELQMQIKALTERNSFLKEQAATMVQRHKDGRLNAEEAALVKEVIQSTLQIGERDSIQKANDIKRRDVIIQTLQARVQDLEKQLATQLDKRSAGQLMTTKDIWSSSPLTQPDDGINKTDQQRSKQPIDATTSTTVHVHKHVTTDTRQDQGTFSHLNRESSEEHDADEIRPFSDPISTTKKRNISQDIVEAVMNEDGYPKSPERRLSRSPIRRALKRGRESASFDADAGTTADTSGTANVRATRKQKKSLGAQEGRTILGIEYSHRSRTQKGNRNAGNGGEAASNAVAVARYKAAQRGKLRR